MEPATELTSWIQFHLALGISTGVDLGYILHFTSDAK